MSSVVMRKKWEARLNTRISGPATKWPPRRSCTCAGGPAHHVANSAGKCCNKNVVNDSVRVRSASERLDEMCGRVGTFSQNNHEKAGRSFTTNCGASCNVSDRDFRVYKNEMGAMPASDYIRWVRSQANPGMVNCPSSTVGGGGAVAPLIDPNAQQFFENVFAFYTTGTVEHQDNLVLGTNFVTNDGFIDLRVNSSINAVETQQNFKLNDISLNFTPSGELLANIAFDIDSFNSSGFGDPIANFDDFYDHIKNSHIEDIFVEYTSNNLGSINAITTGIDTPIDNITKYLTDIDKYISSINDHNSDNSLDTIRDNFNDLSDILLDIKNILNGVLVAHATSVADGAGPGAGDDDDDDDDDDVNDDVDVP